MKSGTQNDAQNMFITTVSKLKYLLGGSDLSRLHNQVLRMRFL
jgi:hypothetical protein